MIRYKTLLVDTNELERTLNDHYLRDYRLFSVAPHQSMQEHGRGTFVVSYLVVLVGQEPVPEPAPEQPKARTKAAAR